MTAPTPLPQRVDTQCTGQPCRCTPYPERWINGEHAVIHPDRHYQGPTWPWLTGTKPEGQQHD